MTEDERRYRTEDFELIDIYVTYNEAEAIFIKEMLDENAIPCFVRGLESSAFPVHIGKHAQIRIVVDEEAEAEARNLLKMAIDENAITDEGNFL